MNFYEIYRLSHPQAQKSNKRAYLIMKPETPPSMLLDFKKIYDEAQKLKREKLK
jgi:hypothetical protein